MCPLGAKRVDVAWKKGTCRIEGFLRKLGKNPLLDRNREE